MTGELVAPRDHSVVIPPASLTAASCIVQGAQRPKNAIMVLADQSEPSDVNIPSPELGAGMKDIRSGRSHPSGRESYGLTAQVLRGISFTIYFIVCCLVIGWTQIIGAPLYFVNREWFYAYMARTKQSFALTLAVMTRIWGPTQIRISGDASVTGQIKLTRNGLVELSFPERIVMIANHQIYTDWIYFWWLGYINRPWMHGHIYIILKESLRYIPLIGTGMMFYGFIFMSRKMATDQPRLAHRLGKLKKRRQGPTGKSYFDPMWLLLFPEGTNLSVNSRRRSAQWAAKNGLKDAEHVILPRSTGTFFCLNELKGTVDYVYDCTVAYEGVLRGKYGEDIFGLSSTYFQGRPPKSVNLFWRRYRIDDIPLDDQEKFDLWLREQWYKKDELIEEYLTSGRFPPMVNADRDYVEVSVGTRYPWELLQILTIPGICGLTWNILRKVWHAAFKSV